MISPPAGRAAFRPAVTVLAPGRETLFLRASAQGLLVVAQRPWNARGLCHTAESLDTHRAGKLGRVPGIRSVRRPGRSAKLTGQSDAVGAKLSVEHSGLQPGGLANSATLGRPNFPPRDTSRTHSKKGGRELNDPAF